MVLFGALVINHDHFNISHAGVSGSDDAMNYGCGTCFLLLLLLSLTLSPFLYYYHWQHRVSWTARFYRFLAFLSCTATLFGSLPMAVYLLMPGYLPKGSGFLSYLNKFFFLLVDFSWVSQLSVVFMLSAMQWVYIHRPLWSLVYGTKLKRVGLIIILCVALFCAGSFCAMLMDREAHLFEWVEEMQVALAKEGTGQALKVALVLMPQLLTVLCSAAAFTATWIMLGANKDERSNTIDEKDMEKINGQMLTVGLLICGNLVWAVLRVITMVYFWCLAVPTYGPVLYTWFLMNNLVPATVETFNVLVITATDASARATLLFFLKTGRVSSV